MTGEQKDEKKGVDKMSEGCCTQLECQNRQEREQRERRTACLNLRHPVLLALFTKRVTDTAGVMQANT